MTVPVEPPSSLRRRSRERAPAHLRPHRYPPKLRTGDRVAVLSPSKGLPAVSPERFELGLERLRQRFGLVPVEYPTTRATDATPEEKAADIMDAFTDPTIAAVWASAGGIDELKVLRHLDFEMMTFSPKAFIGYSDNTNLLLYLFNAGIVSFHGGLVMFQLAFTDQIDPVTENALRVALFDGGEHELDPHVERLDEALDPWAEPPSKLDSTWAGSVREWSWHGPKVRVAGPAWGGSLEVVDFHLRTSRYLLPNESYRGCVGFFETSQELPGPDFVSRVLTCMGERGLLEQFGAVLWGQPASAGRAWLTDSTPDPGERQGFIEAQRDVVLSLVSEYNPAAPVVFGPDFGHTRPQFVIPSGGTVVVDGESQRVTVKY